MPTWLYVSLISLESIFCLYLLQAAFKNCIMHPDYVFKKFPMTILYIIAIIGIVITMTFIWLDVQFINVSNKYDKAVHAVYLSK